MPRCPGVPAADEVPCTRDTAEVLAASNLRLVKKDKSA
jgi:hypothetical protein